MNNEKLTGQILIKHGLITEAQLLECLKEQESLQNHGTVKLLGHIISAKKYATLMEIEKCLIQAGNIKRPGTHPDTFYSAFRSKVVEKIGKDKYVFAVNKKEETKDTHVINTLHKLDILHYSDSHKMLCETLRECRAQGIITDYDHNKLTILEGETYLQTNGNSTKVRPVYYPEQNTDDIQLLMPYDRFLELSICTSANMTEQADDSGTVRTLKEIVRKALLFNASDIHIIPKSDHYRVFFRIDGRFVEIPEFLMNTEQGCQFAKMTRIDASEHTKGEFNSDETKKAQLGKIEYPDLGVGLRLEFVPDGRTLEHVDITARIISKGSLQITADISTNLKKLDYLQDNITSFKSVLNRKNGLLIINGVVNSGKSTFVWNILPALAKDRKIGTIEDPIECILDNYNNIIQHQIYEPANAELRMGFKEYIKSFKRGDYDVIFIGEWRKSDGLTEAITEQANAGQLIFTTLHIKSAFEIYSSIEEMFQMPRTVSARMILLSLNQLLVPRLCEKCKVKAPISFTQDDVRYLNILSQQEKKQLLSFSISGYDRKPEGCPACYGTGYKGRTVIYEYFIPTQEFITEVIKNNLSPNEIKELAIMHGIGKTKLSVVMERLKAGVIEKSRVEEI